MTELLLPVAGPDADDAMTLAAPYRVVRNDVLVPLIEVARHQDQAVARWADVGAHPLPRSLSAEQVVGVGRAIGGALASLHAHGLVHGDVSAATVVRDVDGRPRLAEAGRAVWSGADAAPADDVHGLAQVLAGLLAADASEPATAVTAALAAARSSHPAARPDATTFVKLLGSAAPPAPLPRPGSTDLGVVQPRRRRRPSPVDIGFVQVWRRSRPAQPRSRRWVVGAGVGLAAVVCAAVVVARHGDQRRASPWDTTVRAIAAARWAAFTAADVTRLADADAQGSPAHTVDAQRVRAYASAHAHIRGAAPTPTVVQVLHSGAAVAELLVRESVPAYDEVDDGGALLAHHAAGAPTMWRITLVRSPSGWRTQEVTPG